MIMNRCLYIFFIFSCLFSSIDEKYSYEVKISQAKSDNFDFGMSIKINVDDGIKVISVKSLMNRLPLTASSLYAKNLFSFIRNLYSKEKKDFNINLEDEIIEKSLIKKV